MEIFEEQMGGSNEEKIMARISYRTALRAKGIRKLPKYDRLRSSHKVKDGREHHIVGGAK